MRSRHLSLGRSMRAAVMAECLSTGFGNDDCLYLATSFTLSSSCPDEPRMSPYRRWFRRLECVNLSICSLFAGHLPRTLS
uniref:Putative secreted protein n=1 Tax=Anopheles triannulatus TaxID=58253 RepID=A0A2M4B4V7_9DIPT